MVVERKHGKHHINQLLQQVDPTTWLIGSFVLCRSPYLSEKATWDDNGDNSSYSLTVAHTPQSLTTSPPSSPFIKLVHEAGDASAVWSIDNHVLCKVRYIENGVTPESVTLDFVQGQHPSFDTPKVIHHAFGNDRSYLILQRLPGRTLDKAWPSLSDEWRFFYVNAVVNICKEMAEWEGNTLSGVDNQNVPEYYLQPQVTENFSSLQATCEVRFVFYHADLGPTNIIVEEEPMSGRVGIIDFEIAGYFPQDWMRTKSRLSSGMDLSASASSNSTWWRSEIQMALKKNGFEDFTQANSSSRRHEPAQSSTLSSISQPPPSRFFSPCRLNRRSPIAATEPAHISWLWDKVMSYASDTTSSMGKRNRKTASTISGSALLVDTPSTSEAGTRARKAAAKVNDADFAKSVLEPCGIEIVQQDVNKDLRTHFRREHLPIDAGDRLKDYRKEHPLDNVWLEPDMGCIRSQYRSMGLYGSNEAEFSAYALRDIFLDEPLQPWLPEERGDEMWLPVRMLQFVQKPPDDKWLAPPLLALSEKRYAWDIRPDCAYYVSLQAFQSGFRPNVRNHVAVRQKRAFCSYLTIEFKQADDDTIITARHQIATASAIALYNRYLLKVDAIAAMNRDQEKPKQEKREWCDRDRHQMRHYGITFTGSTWDLWCTVPKTLETWTGCVMSKIYSGDCSVHPGPARLVGIINDIHYWGLHVHGRGCKRDIADKVHADADADTEDITFLEDNGSES